MNSNEWLGGSKMFSVLLVFASLALTSCSTPLIQTSKLPSLETGSPLKSSRPLRVYVGEFQDVRGLEADFIGVGFGVPVPRLRLDKPVSQVVRDSIQREFQRNGHTCLGTGERGWADIKVEGSVYQYVFQFLAGGAGMKLTGTGHVGVKISAKSVSHPDRFFSKNYDGSSSTSRFNWSVQETGETVNDALLNMLEEFTTDREFLEFLKQTGS